MPCYLEIKSSMTNSIDAELINDVIGLILIIKL